ncbi:MAG: signal peptidase II [Fibrobacter sp.]|nr:signal peptidase II [Fibrobacter sp.]
MKEIRHKWLLLILVTLTGFFIDYFSKTLVVSHLSYGIPKKVFGHLLQFVFVYNKGLLFGINPRGIFPGIPLNLLLLVITIVTIGFLVFFYKRIPKHNILLHWGVALICPGALGNLFDRIIRPADGVVDFIQIGLSEKIHWYIFNVADIYVTVGMAVFLYCLLRDETLKKASVYSSQDFKKQSSAGF